jgi:hypothetical protein
MRSGKMAVMVVRLIKEESYLVKNLAGHAATACGRVDRLIPGAASEWFQAYNI